MQTSWYRCPGCLRFYHLTTQLHGGRVIEVESGMTKGRPSDLPRRQRRDGRGMQIHGFVTRRCFSCQAPLSDGAHERLLESRAAKPAKDERDVVDIMDDLMGDD